MQKIPSLYLRDPEDMSQLTREPNPRCRWVFLGEGEATVKYDGTCVMLDSYGIWWARHQVRDGKTIPENYVPVEFDPITKKTQGWIPMEQSQYRKFHDEALHRGPGTAGVGLWAAGSYELIGPKIGANPHDHVGHMLLQHGCTPMGDVPTDYDELAEYLRGNQNTYGGYLEGIVWHGDDGEMAKIKTSDFA